MQFVLTGFTQDTAFRVFEFDYVGPGKVRTQFTVRADLGLIRRYGIQVQDLPALCRDVLEARSEADEVRTPIFTGRKRDERARDGICAAGAKSWRRKEKNRASH